MPICFYVLRIGLAIEKRVAKYVSFEEEVNGNQAKSR